MLATVIFGIAMTGCGAREGPRTVTLWHQMTPAERELLAEEIARFESSHPGIHVESLYKETEELRSGFQAAVLAGAGPELVYGPSDVLDPFQTMGVIQDLSPWLSAEQRDEFVDTALTWLPARDDRSRRELVQVGDRIGNHLALVYNRRFLERPPRTTDELVEFASQQTVDTDGDGRTDRYGLVWNFVEPFFVIPFLTGYGAWVFEEGPDPTPALDSPGAVAAYRFVLSLRDEHHVIPVNCDYEVADALFKSGKAAMIINGDWSWRDYLESSAIDAAIAPLPIVSATGRPMGPMVATKGYSLNANADPAAASAAMELVRHMTSLDTQRRFMVRLKTLPARRELLDDPLLTEDATLRSSAAQMRQGRPMPVVAELRAVWDAMRPHYQALLGGSVEPEQAAADMQRDALARIRSMNQDVAPGASARVVWMLGAGLLAGVVVVAARGLRDVAREWRHNRLAYLFVLPALAVLFLTVVFPFGYNLLLSVSNMSLTHFRQWQVVGLQNYVEVFREAAFLSVLGKTVVWTVVNVAFHVSIGLLLAVALNGVVTGKNVYRVILILPWAVPAYITALTWRGMFDYEYGAVNLIASQYLAMPMINWLGSPREAFAACVLTNVWLGFPFMMVIALGGLQGIPRELYEAAQIDRASRLAQFRYITLPLLKPVLLPAMTLGAIWTFNNLNVVWLVSNGGEPSDKTHILVSYVYKSAFNLYRYGYGAALSMIIFGILLVFSLTFLRRARATQNVY